jgi:hypothetical protein
MKNFSQYLLKYLRLLCSLMLVFIFVFSSTPAAWAFCGFYVAKADTHLYNKASQVIIARNHGQTVLTMANDFQGDVKDFALVVPVPTLITKEQVKVAPPKIVERLDAFSAPRLVEYFDPDPCSPLLEDEAPMPGARGGESRNMPKSSNSLGITVEAKFNVGEYDIVILSAKESGGLETWLNLNGYKIPVGAKQLLQPYIRSSMKFFVAKVNLHKFHDSGEEFLRPLQISYESGRFMLPIRLGMVNAKTEQDLIIYLLTSQGQAEITNYRTVKVPSNVNIPMFVKQEFGHFYKSMFQTAYTREDKKVAFLEYAWNMNSCDPCSAQPLNPQELKDAGVFWVDDANYGTQNNFLTRLHVRYTRNEFPEDLMFQETSDRESFQGRYILQHPFTGESHCPAIREYEQSLPPRFEQEAQTLAQLTNWPIEGIRHQMK